MSWFIYIIAHGDGLHVGMTTDLKKTYDWYQQLPSLLFSGIIHRLVYCEEYITNAECKARLEELNKNTKAQKLQLIAGVNPRWMALIPGVNFEMRSI